MSPLPPRGRDLDRRGRIDVGTISAVVRFLDGPLRVVADQREIYPEARVRVLPAAGELELSAIAYLNEDSGLAVIENLVRDRLPPGYDVASGTVGLTNSIEIVLLLTAAYRLTKDTTEVVETLTSAAHILRDATHVVLGNLGGPLTLVTASIDSDPYVGSAGEPEPAAVPYAAVAAGMSARRVGFLLLVLTYLVVLAVGVVFVLSRI